MNVIRRVLQSYRPQFIVQRKLRRFPNRDSKPPGKPVSSGPTIPALQVPLTEEELSVLAGGGPYLKTIPEARSIPKKKEQTTLKERVKPEVNPPLSEPVTTDTQHEMLAKAVTPLYQVPYSRQMVMKHKKTEDVMRTLGKQLINVHGPIARMRKGLPCPVEPLKPSPDLIGYRNKDEFGIHFGVDGNPKTVGFFVGKPTDPLMVCVPPTYLINMRESHKRMAQRFQSFIEQSPHQACHRFDTQGIWRNLMVRSTRSDESMATVYIHPQDLTEDAILEIMGSLEDFFFHGEGADCQLDSLYLQACPHTRCTREQAPYRLIKGKEFITETCEGLSFRISPDSFFQINTGGAELLYRTIREISEASPLTTLLDVCSGTGTISLVMAPYIRGAVGIEATTGAVDDAKVNAQLNNVPNVQFIAGRAEQVLPRITPELEDCTDVLAIMNPARGGLKPNVINAIRKCEAVRKLIYISCKPEGVSMENFVRLCSVKGKTATKEKTVPFLPKYVVPIDMFPHTHHTEVVILFERVSM